jgi:hypothetical protein
MVEAMKFRMTCLYLDYGAERIWVVARSLHNFHLTLAVIARLDAGVKETASDQVLLLGTGLRACFGAMRRRGTWRSEHPRRKADRLVGPTGPGTALARGTAWDSPNPKARTSCWFILIKL